MTDKNMVDKGIDEIQGWIARTPRGHSLVILMEQFIMEVTQLQQRAESAEREPAELKARMK